MEPYAPYPFNLLREWLHRRRWWIRLVLAIVLVPCLGDFVYTRWTTLPPSHEDAWDLWYGDALQYPPAELDRTEDLVAAMLALPPTPSIPVPAAAPADQRWVEWESAHAWAGSPDWSNQVAPSPGMTVDVDFDNARCGKWEPGRRLQLGEIIKYLELQATRDALDRIADLSGEQACYPVSSAPNQWSDSTFRRLARVMTARMRYSMAEKGNFDAAAQDAKTLLQLIENYEDDGVYIRVLVGTACRRMVLRELIVLSREHDLTLERCGDLIQWLEQHPYDARAMFGIGMQGEAAWVRNALDAHYTYDDDGGGWFAIYNPKGRGQEKEPLFRIGNLFSPVFDDRETALAAVDRIYGAAIEASRLSYADATIAIRRANYGPYHPTSPANMYLDVGSRGLYLGLLEQARHGAAIASLALSAYKAEHGAYPEALDALVPRYMSTLPIDPLDEKRLRYRRDDRFGYVLYSVGEDGTDDGGRWGDESGDRLPSDEDRQDVGFPEEGDYYDELGHRSRPYDEWVLVPLAGEGGSNRP